MCNYKKSGKLKFSADKSLLGLAGDRTTISGRSNQNLRAIERQLAGDRTKTCGRSNQN
ncbi:MAG: hypothetical protein MUE44_23560 [Oscillatoriaceae cyanobacterium Prado104]|nr:hypothetical protein [Oscillatoriaceae cyanobacterium Prado104]